MFRRLLNAEGQTRAAKSVEVFGWLILVESVILMLAPHFAPSCCTCPPRAARRHYLSLPRCSSVALACFISVGGRLNAEGFVFASLLDRPLVPPVMAVPGTGDHPLAAGIALCRAGRSFLWTLSHGARSRASRSRCRSENRVYSTRSFIRFFVWRARGID